MYMALMQKKESGEINIDIPCESTVCKVIEQSGLIHKPHSKSCFTAETVNRKNIPYMNCKPRSDSTI